MPAPAPPLATGATSASMRHAAAALLAAAALVAPTAAAPSPPPEWVPRIAGYNLLWTPNDAAINPNNMPEIGNGFVATQVSSDSLYLSGIFNGYLTSTPSHIARVPATNAFAAPGGSVVAAGIDVLNATYYRRSVLAPRAAGAPACTPGASWLVSCSNAPVPLTVEQRWYAHRTLPSLLVMEVEILPPAPGSAAAAALAASGPYNCSYPLASLALNNNGGGPSPDLNFTAVPTSSGSPYTLLNGTTYVAETNTSGLQGVALAVSALPVLVGPGGEGEEGTALSAVCPGSQPNAAVFTAAGLTWPHITALRTSIETSPSRLVAAAAADWALAVALASNGTLHASHIAAWAMEAWPAGYETDRPDVAAAVNTSLLALQSSSRPDRPYGVGPGGLTSGYNGHTFWDLSTWQAPSLQLLHPDMASSFLLYRSLRLEGAYVKAASYDPPYAGAAFPWESALTGQETCPTWAATGLREMHIGGDISFEVYQYWRLAAGTFNSSSVPCAFLGAWLDRVGFPVLAGIADFWVGKAVADTPGASVPGWPRSSPASPLPSSASPLTLADVIPPDEYHDHVNNSVYTNAVARIALQVAVSAAQTLGLEETVWGPWANAAPRLVQLLSDTTPPGAPPGSYPGGWHPEFQNYAGDQIKQADAVLLGFPLDAPFVGMNATVRANDLDYYANVTDPDGPAMTWSMFAVGYTELDRPDTAAAYFNRSFANAQAPFAVWTETPTGGAPNFLTGAGGFLQAVFFGYPGLRIRDAALEWRPAALPGASYYKLRGVAYVGNRLDVTVNATAVVIELQAQGPLAGAAVQRRAYAVGAASALAAEATEAAASAHCAAGAAPERAGDADDWRGVAAGWLDCGLDASAAGAQRWQAGRVALPSFLDDNWVADAGDEAKAGIAGYTAARGLVASNLHTPPAVPWEAVPGVPLEVVDAAGHVTRLGAGGVSRVVLPLPQAFRIQVAGKEQASEAV